MREVWNIDCNNTLNVIIVIEHITSNRIESILSSLLRQSRQNCYVICISIHDE